MVEYRRITAEDVPAVASFAIEGLPRHDGLRLSRVKVEAVVSHFAHTPSDFHLVAFHAGQVVGAIAACVTEMAFFERCEATVMVCQARGPLGIGRELLTRLKAWADGEMRIRRVQFPIDAGARPGYARLIAQYGFQQVSQTCIFSKE